MALVENVFFFSKPKEKKVIIGRTPRSCTHVHNHVTNCCFHKNGITFSICGHFCAVKPCHHVTSIPWDVYTATTLNLTLTLISKTLKTGLNITCTSSNKIVFSDGSDLEFGEFYLAFLGITSLALVEDVVFFSKPKEKKKS